MRLIGITMLLLGTILISACEGEKEVALPFLGQSDVEYKMVDGVEVADTVYPTIPAFKYLNQDSVLVKSSDMQGKIWISDFFFTTCPTICPVMTKQMKRLQEMTSDLEDDIQFMSFSINPTYDQPHVLTKYRAHHKITAKNWNFFTGNEEATHALGIESFLVFADDDESAPGGYAHSDVFTLVDKEGHVRGVYHGTVPKEVDQLEKDLRKLLEIEYGIIGSK